MKRGRWSLRIHLEGSDRFWRTSGGERQDSAAGRGAVAQSHRMTTSLKTSTGAPPPVTLRSATEDDYPAVAQAIQSWWTLPGLDTASAARERAALVPRLWLQHFATTSLVAECDGALAGFLVGLLSQDRSEEAYIHFVGVAPDQRGRGIGRMLYERFFELCRRASRSWVRCVTSPVNTHSIAFHEAMGFAIERTDGAIAKADYDGPGVARVAFLRSTVK
jgi:ribosomal protein S18 acetylase RimI-like enzyme